MGLQQRRRRDVSRADAVAVRDGGEPLHGGAEQAAERLGLCLAELRVFGGHMGDRAVVLAELLAPAGGWRAAGGRRVTVCGQRLGQGPHPLAGGAGANRGAVPAFQVGDLPPGELGHRGRSAALGQEPQRAGGEIVVGVLEGAAPAAGVRPSRALRPVAVAGPFSRISLAILARVPRSAPDSVAVAWAGAVRRVWAASDAGPVAGPPGAVRTCPMYFTTSLCRK